MKRGALATRAAPRRLAALAMTVLLPLSAQAQAEIAGEWWTPGFAARVRIEPCGDALCGRIVWLWDEAAGPQALIGRRVVDGMRAAQAGRWAGGSLHDPEDGRSYKGSLQLQTSGALRLEGCFGPFCRSQVWQRVDAARCPPTASR